MSILRSNWLPTVASLLFLCGSLSFLDADRYVVGAWLFVLGSIVFLSHSVANVVAERRSSD